MWSTKGNDGLTNPFTILHVYTSGLRYAFILYKLELHAMLLSSFTTKLR